MKARFGCARLPRDIQGQKVWVSAILAGRCNRLSRRFATANPVSRAPVSAISKFCILVSLMLFLAPWLISERSRTPRVVASQCCRQSKPRGVEQIPANNIFRHSSNGLGEKRVFSPTYCPMSRRIYQIITSHFWGAVRSFFEYARGPRVSAHTCLTLARNL